ncbi:hypothetical protein EB052_00465 [bacterium]|nr:hypothetical protein [bacterium]
MNGGALLLAPNSIIEDAAPSAVILIKNMATALHGKKLHDVCLYAHAPCLVATEAGMNILQTIKDVVEAKQAVREKLASTITNLRVHIFYHVDYGIVNRKRKMRTYRINKKRWEEVMSMLPPAS